MSSAFAGVQAANLALQARTVAPSTANRYIVNWDPDLLALNQETLVLLMGPDDLGLPGTRKFFRGIRLLGTGVARLMVFVDGKFVKEGLLTIQENAQHTRLLWLPRGTKGYKLSVLVSHQGYLEAMEPLFDTIGSLESDS